MYSTTRLERYIRLNTVTAVLKEASSGALGGDFIRSARYSVTLGDVPCTATLG